MDALPGAVFAALVFPGIVGAGVPGGVAAGVIFAATRKTGNVLLALLLGVGTVALLRGAGLLNREVLRMNRIDFFRRLGKLLLGLFLFALGIVVTMKANLGFGPWEVFHQGVSVRIGLSIGNVSILTGLLICVLVVLAGEKLGLGTILNMVLIGVFMDRILALGVIPRMESFLPGLLVMFTGLFTISLASYFYIGSVSAQGPGTA
jgi:Predicted membrane protein